MRVEMDHLSYTQFGFRPLNCTVKESMTDKREAGKEMTPIFVFLREIFYLSSHIAFFIFIF